MKRFFGGGGSAGQPHFDGRTDSQRDKPLLGTAAQASGQAPAGCETGGAQCEVTVTFYLRGKIWGIVYSVRGKQYAESAKPSNKRDAEKLLRLRLRKVSSERRFVNPAQEERYVIGDLKKQLVESYERKQNRSTNKMLSCMAHVEEAFQFLRLVDIDTERIHEYSAAKRGRRARLGESGVAAIEGRLQSDVQSQNDLGHAGLRASRGRDGAQRLH